MREASHLVCEVAVTAAAGEAMMGLELVREGIYLVCEAAVKATAGEAMVGSGAV